MDRLRALSAFCTVAELEGISAAARALGVSKAVVSKYITLLEVDLGVRLFHRSTRKMTVTAVGREVHALAQRIGEQVEELESVGRKERREPSGVLRISVPMAFGAIHVAPRVADFRRRHPNVRIDMSFGDRYVRIAEEGFDLAIRIATGLPDQACVAVKLATVKMVACASRAYLERVGAPRAPADLTSHDCLAYSPPGGSGPTTWRFGRRGGEREVRIEPAVRADHSLALADLCIEGLGVALLPSFVSDRLVRSGALVELFTAAASEDRTVFAMYPSRLQLSAKVAAFVHFLKASSVV